MSEAITLQVPSARSWGRRQALYLWWDRFSIYLPAVLMVLLALATYGLLQSTPEPPPPVPEREATHDPDFFMRNFRVKVFDPSGALKTELVGTEARHYPDINAMVVDNARVLTYNPQRRETIATALQITSNDEATVFELQGNAKVVRQATQAPDGQILPQLEFHGEYLRVAVDPDHVSSDRPVRLVRGLDQVTGDTLDYVGETRVANLVGQVRAQFAAR
jgi:lipopolysaccharide export system protein LptC